VAGCSGIRTKPEEIYENPANGFVARFIGRSNRYEGTVLDGGIVALRGGAKIALNAMPKAGSAVELVIRHEDATLVPLSNGGAQALTAKIRLRSFIGSRVQYVLDLEGDVEFVAEVAASGPAGRFGPGEQVILKINPDRAFVAPLTAQQVEA
jgi:putative spermidine/putrescine transport system ATP-binding protein